MLQEIISTEEGGWQSPVQQTALNHGWGTEEVRVRWLHMDACPSHSASTEPDFIWMKLHLSNNPTAKKLGNRKAPVVVGFKIILLKAFEKVEKESRISVKSMFNPLSPSPPNLHLLRTGKIPSPTLPAHSGQEWSVSITTASQEGR